MSNREDELERQFNADLEKAIALSLETSQLEKIQSERRKNSIIEASGWRGRPTASVTPLPTPLAIKEVTPLPPPPASATRRQSAQSDTVDLISFHSPTKPDDSANLSIPDLDQFLSTNNNFQPSLLPHSSLPKADPPLRLPPEIGFKREVLLRHNPFPLPAPNLSFPQPMTPSNSNLSFPSPGVSPHRPNLGFSQNLSFSPSQYPQTPAPFSAGKIPGFPYQQTPPQPTNLPSFSSSPYFQTGQTFGPNLHSSSQQKPFTPPSDHSQSNSPDISALYAQPIPKNLRNNSANHTTSSERSAFSTQQSSVYPSLSSLKRAMSKREDANLIDLTPEKDAADSGSATVLEAFDPLAPSQAEDDGSSIYDVYDPFEYMAGGSSLGEAVYAEVEPPEQQDEEALMKKEHTADWIRSSLVFDSSRIVRPQLSSVNKGAKALLERVEPWVGHVQLEGFCMMVTDLRASFLADERATNPGLVLAATVDCDLRNGLNVKLVVNCPLSSCVATFTSDLCTSIEHVTAHVLCELEGDLGGYSADDFVLKVGNASEFMRSASTLGDYEYVYQCIKLDRDVALTLVPVASLQRPLARTHQDDQADVPLLPQHVLPAHVHAHPISYETLFILLETVEREMERLTQAAHQLNAGNEVAPRFTSVGVEQAVKALCSVMGQLETVEITMALASLNHAFKLTPRPVRVIEDRGNYSTVAVDQAVSKSCEGVREAVHSLIQSYSGAFNVDFRLCGSQATHDEERSIVEVSDPLLVFAGALHRPDPTWRFARYLVEIQVYHGTRALRAPHRSAHCPPSRNFYERVVFNTWLSLDDVPMKMLPRESRLVFALFGLQPLSPDHDRSKKHPGVQQYEKVELGWSALQCFDHAGLLTQGRFLLSLWPVTADKRMGPAPQPGTQPIPLHPVLEVALPEYSPRPKFFPPQQASQLQASDSCEWDSLDPDTQQMLLDVTMQDTFSLAKPEDREILWEKRHYLVKVPQALPKVLLLATGWDALSLPDLHNLLQNWTRLSPLAALQLLLPCFPDMAVRSLAISCLRELSPDELVDYLPQLVQALKHETYEENALARYLLEQALMSPRVAHHLFWLLVQILPGDNPQNSEEGADIDLGDVAEYRYHWRLRLLLRALLAIAGSAMRYRLCSQLQLVKALYDAAQRVKLSKESIRVRSLLAELEILHHNLQEEPSGLPLSPSVSVSGVQVRTCSYFPSKTLPLKIDFLNDEGRLVPAIFKVGDDLQQDALTLQMIRVMDKLWLKEGLDLRMVTFACVPTGSMRGMIELVTNAETLRKIQTEHGLTGSFKDRPIAEWLAKHNPGALEYARAVTNFTASCAGYSVVTYVLGVCDRHNDNIMLNRTGHLFHIDFGKFLGDAQMFGNFKRDRAPFVLTSDMAYVINGGDKPSQSFQQFVDLCCHAFAIVRQHSNVILNLLGFMVGSGIPGVTLDSMRYVQRALLPGLSRAEAAACFSRLINSALSSWFTQFNFFLHNLSQLRAGGDRDGGGDLLSFVPKKHTCEEDGRIIGTQVHNVQKRYGTEKHYVYVVRVDREGQPEPSFIFRTYREFCELHNKLCALFPLAKLYSLQAGLQIGRSAVKHVAERRKFEIEKFLVSLFRMADELSHSDVVYTFFHPLLRDQEDVSIDQRKVKDNKRDIGNSNALSGQLKLSLSYQRGTLTVMVAHARGLAKVAGGQEPSTYVKVYLLPDPAKCTKRKTKVVKKNCHPTFMEMLEYRMPLDAVRNRTLQATVWSYDSLQENEFLGGVNFPLEQMRLDREVSEWFPLGMVPR